jgi:pimeloyl-ACP methyl ester carboxylesterase
LWDETVAALAWAAPVQRLRLGPGTTIDAIADGIAAAAPERFVLVGFSLGGYVARAIAARHPGQVAALILVGTSLRGDTPAQARAMQGAVDAARAGSFRGLSTHAIAGSLHPGHRHDAQLLARIKTMGDRLGREALIVQANLQREGIAAGSLTCPTLIIAAAQDELRSAEEARELAAAIPGAALVTLERSGHMLPLEQPVALASAITAWVRTLGLEG